MLARAGCPWSCAVPPALPTRLDPFIPKRCAKCNDTPFALTSGLRPLHGQRRTTPSWELQPRPPTQLRARRIKDTFLRLLMFSADKEMLFWSICVNNFLYSYHSWSSVLPTTTASEMRTNSNISFWSPLYQPQIFIIVQKTLERWGFLYMQRWWWCVRNTCLWSGCSVKLKHFWLLRSVQILMWNMFLYNIHTCNRSFCGLFAIFLYVSHLVRFSIDYNFLSLML